MAVMTAVMAAAPAVREVYPEQITVLLQTLSGEPPLEVEAFDDDTVQELKLQVDRLWQIPRCDSSSSWAPR